MLLYHGSKNEIKVPQYHFGNPKNDYGFGFYCTQNVELAKEWGCTEESDGFANEYELDFENLSVLDLSDKKYNILNWLAILLENRTFDFRTDVIQESFEYIRKNFLVDYENYDVIKGYRADDSYFSYATAFLNNALSLQKLNRAMFLGMLGEQIVLKSQKSFDKIEFIKTIQAPSSIYYPKKSNRDSMAREDFQKMKKEKSLKDEIFIMNLIQQEIKNGDESLQRALSL